MKKLSLGNRNVQIVSVEGKDVLTKNYIINDNTLKIGSLDYSMETDKLKTLGKNIIKYDRFDEKKIIFKLKSDSDVIINQNDNYIDDGVIALYDNENIISYVTIENNVDTSIETIFFICISPYLIIISIYHILYNIFKLQKVTSIYT